ncbi:MAG: ABC transporter substrate-binding protein [Actinobacteria bacterium]|nr:ABC transporter substrate-binding protein [Actinomycetota bacterium]
MDISATDRIGELLHQHPQLLDVFRAKGFKAETTSELIDSLGEDTMLKTVLSVKGIDPALFLVMLNERLGTDMALQQIAYDFYDPDAPVNLLVKTACPINALFKDQLYERVAQNEADTGRRVNTYLVDGCNAPHAFDRFWEPDTIDGLPDIIMSMSFDEMYDGRFVEKYVTKGHFENVLRPIRSGYEYLDCEDDAYTLIAALALVIVVDEAKLGDLPLPRRWEDLLDPMYRDKIVGFGNNGRIFEYSMYYFFKEFGPEGVKKIAENTKGIFHAAKMTKLVGTNNRDAEAIYIMPLTFAEMCRKQKTTIIYPEDGAWMIPMSCLVKKEKKEELAGIIDFVVHTYGQMCADMSAVAFSPKAVNRVGPEIKLKWLGWDHIKGTDMWGHGKAICEDFHAVYDNKAPVTEP